MMLLFLGDVIIVQFVCRYVNYVILKTDRFLQQEALPQRDEKSSTTKLLSVVQLLLPPGLAQCVDVKQQRQRSLRDGQRQQNIWGTDTNWPRRPETDLDRAGDEQHTHHAVCGPCPEGHRRCLRPVRWSTTLKLPAWHRPPQPSHVPEGVEKEMNTKEKSNWLWLD